METEKWIFLIDVMCLLANSSMIIINYKFKNHKTTLFSAFVSGILFALCIRQFNLF